MANNKNQGKFISAKDACEHPPGQLTYLESRDTPHLQYPETNMVVQAMFWCKKCNEVIVKHVEMARGYDADGNIPVDMMTKIKETQVQHAAIAEARRKQAAEAAMRQEAERAAAEATPVETTEEVEATADAVEATPVETTPVEAAVPTAEPTTEGPVANA